jgi:hypothetical protein
VVSESPTAEDSLAEEQQQPGDHDTEDKTNEEHPPPSDAEAKKMYQDADKVESFRAESLVIAGRLRVLLEHPGITTTPWYRIKEVPRSGQVEFKVTAYGIFHEFTFCHAVLVCAITTGETFALSLFSIAAVCPLWSLVDLAT